MWETVDLRELRAFLTLAEELHFGRTAERLRLTPSRVSQSIRALEHKLGAELVYRTSRQVQLTAAGERFQREAGSAYARLMGVLERTQQHSGSIDGVLRLAILSAPAAGPRLLAIVDAFAGRHPECRVEVAQVPFPDGFAQLDCGEVDVMATWLPVDDPDVAIGPTLAVEPRVLAVARDHQLAKLDEISIEELANWKVGRFEGLSKELHEAWVPSRTPNGRPIPRDPQRLLPNDIATLTVKLARGEVVHPTVLSAATLLGREHIAYIPIPDMPPLRSALVWRRRTSDARVRKLVDIAREMLSHAEGNDPRANAS